MKSAPTREAVIVEKVLGRPKADGGVLVCGLPGSGYVGKLAAENIVETLKMTEVAEYRSRAFPPQVNVDDEGVGVLPKGTLYFTSKTKGPPLLVFTADAQPVTSEGEYELADTVVKFAKSCGAKKVYALAAYITGSFAPSPRVFGAATSKPMLDELVAAGAVLMKDGGISGMNGLLVGMATLRGLQGACLLGETSGYVVDAGASKAVIETLTKAVGITIDTTKLKAKAEETQKVISQLQSMSDQETEAVPPQRQSRPAYIG